MATDTTVNNLIINKLTKVLYDAIANPSDTELYLVPDEIDSTPTSGSENPVTSGGVYTALSGKLETLISGTNIKTINNTSILGSGNISISGGSGGGGSAGTLDTTATSALSTNNSEDLSGNITLHKISKTGTYSDLIGTPTIPDVSSITNNEINLIWDRIVIGIISFTIDNITYLADVNMTWGEWVESAYNTEGFQVNASNEIETSTEDQIIENVNDNDVIQQSTNYTLIAIPEEEEEP